MEPGQINVCKIDMNLINLSIWRGLIIIKKKNKIIIIIIIIIINNNNSKLLSIIWCCYVGILSLHRLLC